MPNCSQKPSQGPPSAAHHAHPPPPLVSVPLPSQPERPLWSATLGLGADPLAQGLSQH